MNKAQVVEVGKSLLPYLRTDISDTELGLAAHDAAAALKRTGIHPPTREIVRNVVAACRDKLMTPEAATDAIFALFGSKMEG